MPYPDNYKKNRALELGCLIREAYEQFGQFKNKEPWEIPRGYELIRELNYPWTASNALDNNYLLEAYFKNLLTVHKSEKIQIPIGFIARKKRNIYVIFRGTQTVKEWINNINIKLDEYFIEGFGAVHQGFSASYGDIRESMMETLENVRKLKKVYVAGHSLGGAFATLAAIDIERMRHKRLCALYTFASPRVGDREFAMALNRFFRGKSFRIANTSDIVCETPFPAPIAGIFGGYYSHIEDPVLFTDQKEDIEENHDMETYMENVKSQKPSGGLIFRFFRIFRF